MLKSQGFRAVAGYAGPLIREFTGALLVDRSILGVAADQSPCLGFIRKSSLRTWTALKVGGLGVAVSRIQAGQEPGFKALRGDTDHQTRRSLGRVQPTQDDLAQGSGCVTDRRTGLGTGEIVSRVFDVPCLVVADRHIRIDLDDEHIVVQEQEIVFQTIGAIEFGSRPTPAIEKRPAALGISCGLEGCGKFRLQVTEGRGAPVDQAGDEGFEYRVIRRTFYRQCNPQGGQVRGHGKPRPSSR